MSRPAQDAVNSEGGSLWPYVKLAILLILIVGALGFLGCMLVSTLFGWSLHDVCFFVFRMVRK